mmetsp:Transcript_6720/g.25330  ORF Transcript_6720/g.25330 Transcript_6720/m.25330 type:complete len:358 (+) Transcript_6720:1815-2888(+)
MKCDLLFGITSTDVTCCACVFTSTGSAEWPPGFCLKSHTRHAPSKCPEIIEFGPSPNATAFTLLAHIILATQNPLCKSHAFIVRSCAPETARFGSHGLNLAAHTLSAWPVMVCRTRPLAASHRRTALSVPAPRIVNPPASLGPVEKSQSRSAPVAPVSRAGPVASPVSTSHRLMTLSSPAVARTSPPGVRAIRCVPPALARIAIRFRVGKYRPPRAASNCEPAKLAMLAADASDKSLAIARSAPSFFWRFKSSYRSLISFIFSASCIFMCNKRSSKFAFSASKVSAFDNAASRPASRASASSAATCAVAIDTSSSPSKLTPRATASSRSPSTALRSSRAIFKSSSHFASASFAAMTC